MVFSIYAASFRAGVTMTYVSDLASIVSSMGPRSVPTCEFMFKSAGAFSKVVSPASRGVIATPLAGLRRDENSALWIPLRLKLGWFPHDCRGIHTERGESTPWRYEFPCPSMAV